ncbi:Hsp70 family protein [Vibrio quintilis]|uniref:Chaperone protein DnaK n=1 Tax=Vibrio quintilis TaxID=1117707 RepID=A0A1M7YSE5_9VIBR|nr:Hsp70 family protein [Vibrio quintilis]SHO55539.1 Chaperone protein DnaK [Vibrio quintilis]
MSRYLILLMGFIFSCAVHAGGIIVEPDSPVAQGPALTEDIGIEMQGGELNPVLFMGCEIPCRHIQTFSTADDDQEEITIHMFRGRSKYVKDDVDLGSYKLSGIYPQKKGKALIQILFGVSDGRIWIMASDVNGYADIHINRVEAH